jgi:hypothetical protein
MHRHAAHNSKWEFPDAIALFSSLTAALLVLKFYFLLETTRLMSMQEVIEQILQPMYVSIEEMIRGTVMFLLCERLYFENWRLVGAPIPALALGLYLAVIISMA